MITMKLKMKVLFLSMLSTVQLSLAFTPPQSFLAQARLAISVATLFSTTEEKKETDQSTPAGDGFGVNDAGTVNGEVSPDPNAEGLPWWWELVWKLDIMKKGEPGEPIKFGDSANVLRTNIEQIYGGYPSLDGCPLAGRV
jgi:hypothetical protein